MFGTNEVEFRENQAEAFRKALAATRLSLKQIANAIGKDGDTVSAYARGAGNLHGAVIDALDNLFCSYGYYRFIEDIYGEVFARRRDRALKLQQEAARLKATAEMMEVA